MDEFDIRLWRSRMGFSQVEAANRLNAPFGTYRNWDQGLIKTPGPIVVLCQMIEAERNAGK